MAALAAPVPSLPRAHKAEAKVAVPVAGLVPVAIGGADVARVVVPAAATVDPVGPAFTVTLPEN